MIIKTGIFSVVLLSLILTAGTCVSSTPAGDSAPDTRPRYLYPKDYMADPAAHVFNGKIYIYPSHDIPYVGSVNLMEGGAYDMRDYHVFSMEDVLYGEITDHGAVLSLSDIPWATRQLWDNDVAHKNGKYYMYFPAKDKNARFRIGVAIADRPEGPFIPEPEPIRGSYSIDPCVFEEDGNYYMYFGGIGGGQLQLAEGNGANSRVVKLSDDMLQFAETPREVLILDKYGRPILNNRFFEASWMHKYNGTYYFSYSTGELHTLCYATGDNPYGPFTYQGEILSPVVGWTTHHSIVEYKDKWYLFYHDAGPSGGVDHFRSMKVTELKYNPDGTIVKMSGMARSRSN